MIIWKGTMRVYDTYDCQQGKEQTVGYLRCGGTDSNTNKGIAFRESG